MKKQYIKPATETYMTELEQMIAASAPSFIGDEGRMSIFSDKHASGDAMSKGHGFDLWGDDEE